MLSGAPSQHLWTLFPNKLSRLDGGRRQIKRDRYAQVPYLVDAFGRRAPGPARGVACSRGRLQNTDSRF